MCSPREFYDYFEDLKERDDDSRESEVNISNASYEFTTANDDEYDLPNDEFLLEEREMDIAGERYSWTDLIHKKKEP